MNYCFEASSLLPSWYGAISDHIWIKGWSWEEARGGADTVSRAYNKFSANTLLTNMVSRGPSVIRVSCDINWDANFVDKRTGSKQNVPTPEKINS